MEVRAITSAWIQRAETCNLKQTAPNARSLQAESRFEIYGQKSQNGKESEVDIYIAIKK